MFFLLDFSSRHLLTRAIVLYGDPGLIFFFLFRSPYMIMKESVCKVLIRSKFVCVEGVGNSVKCIYQVR